MLRASEKDLPVVHTSLLSSMYERTLFKNITKMEENDISFELDATRCNCDLENCTETCEKAYDCFHGICVCSDYSIDLPERRCHLRRKFKVDTTTLNSMVTLKKIAQKTMLLS